MEWTKHQSKHENLTYVALWSMLFAAPLLSLYIRTAADSDLRFNWGEVFMVWQQFAGYLALFLIHNFLLAPLLVYRQKRAVYFSLIAVMVAAFLLFQCQTRPDERGPHPHPMAQHEPPRGEPDFDHEPPPFEGDELPMHTPGDHQPGEGPMHGQPPALMLGQHDVIALIILILMLGMNVGIKLYFKTRRDTKQLLALEKQNLEQQLEYLKYQINPHFFMNTLNNIHALVDIDPEKAKDTILELSKMMRFVLYEGNKEGVPLSREFDFIRNYIKLMRLRYTDKVRIEVDLPSEPPDRQVPPLMLITFIENAFKHGISYQQPSFIEVKVGIEHERLRFCCRNSKADKPGDKPGGVGLKNVKQRLNLIYGKNFTLKTEDESDIYNVELEIPIA